MRLLIINYEYPPIGGGAANVSYYTAKALAKLGHEVVVCTTAFEALKGYSVEEGVHTYRLPSLRKHSSKSNILEMSDSIRHACMRAPDIIRQHQLEAVIAFFTIPGGPVAWYLKKRLGLPYAIFLCGGDVPGHAPDSVEVIHKFTTPLRRAILRNAVGIAAPSIGLAEESKTADPFPVAVIPTGVDCDWFSPPATPTPEPFAFLYVGRMHPEKNPRFFVEQLGRLAKHHDRAWVAHMVGDGAQRQELETLAHELGIGERMHWHGRVPAEELPQRFRDAHCLVLPSFYEGLSSTALEAMASGLPVVASKVVGNVDLITDGENGLLLPLDDLDAWEQGFLGMIDHVDRVRTMGANARQLVLERYTWEAAAKAFVRQFQG